MNGLSGSDFVRASADDDTNGMVVGRFALVGWLYYEDRPQTQQFYANTQLELQDMAVSRKAELMAENPLIYTHDGWTLRIVG